MDVVFSESVRGKNLHLTGVERVRLNLRNNDATRLHENGPWWSLVREGNEMLSFEGRI